jgi:hypothetical protein
MVFSATLNNISVISGGQFYCRLAYPFFICGISGKFWVPVHHFIAVPYIIDVSTFPVIKKTMSKRQNFDNKPKIDLKC